MNEEEMAEYFISAEWQTRDNLQTDDRLTYVAQYRAYDMCANSYFSHRDLNGLYPNWHVKVSGYKLPSFYQENSNQVESMASGFLEWKGAMDALAESPDHTSHMRGLGFWKTHTFFGVGISAHDDCRIYVVITAPPEEGEENEHTIHLPIISRGVRA